MKRIFYLFFIILLLNTVDVYADERTVSNYSDLETAILEQASEINIDDDFEYNGLLTINYDVVINGGNHVLTRDSAYTNTFINISAGVNVEINNLTIDGGAPGWTMDIENANPTSYARVPTIDGENDVLATAPLIVNSGNLTIKKSTIQNVRNKNTSVNGGAISSTTGNLVIEESTIRHAGAYRNGGGIYATSGNVTVDNCTFIGNVGGVGYMNAAHGGAIFVNGTDSLTITNSLFEDNLSQHNGGAIMIYAKGTNFYMKDTILRHNMAGNDGFAVSMQADTVTRSATIIDTTFENNVGLASSGQSLGTFWVDSFKNTEDDPIVFKNLIFKENSGAGGACIASYGTHYPYYSIEDIECYENSNTSFGAFMFQYGTYNMNNIDIHDNTAGSGTGISVVGGEITARNVTIKNNEAKTRGGAIQVLFGNLVLIDSEVTNNHTQGNGGGIATYSSYPNYGQPSISLHNVLVKDNSADVAGGGFAAQDTENAYTTIDIDDDTKIYDNSAVKAADDFFYSRPNQNTGSVVTLDNISIAGVRGIDGWYHDNQDDRFVDTDNPTVFNDYVAFDPYNGIYLKAAGINEASYDLNGGEGVSIDNITLRYGQEYTISNQVPQKPGYKFVGWNTREDGSGMELNSGDVYNGKDGLVLYAQYEIYNPETSDNILKELSTIIICLSMISGLTLIKKRIH